MDRFNQRGPRDQDRKTNQSKSSVVYKRNCRYQCHERCTLAPFFSGNHCKRGKDQVNKMAMNLKQPACKTIFVKMDCSLVF